MADIKAGWSAPDKKGCITFTQKGGCCMASHPPERDGYEVRFVACHSGVSVTWTYRPVEKVDA